MRRIASRLEGPRPSRWPLFGMLALGLVAGAAIGGYAVSQRGQMKRLSAYVRRMGDGLTGMGDGLTGMDIPETGLEDEPTVPRSNYRRKATSEV